MSIKNSNKTRILKCPSGYKDINEISKEEKNCLKQTLWSACSLDEHYDYKNSPIIDFHSLGNMSRLFDNIFEQGQDISFIVSVADWTEHIFKSATGLSHILKQHRTYQSQNKSGFFNFKNACIVFENFFQYVQPPEIGSQNYNAEKSYYDNINNECIKQLCIISIHLYCYHKKFNNSSEMKTSLTWFNRFYQQSKDFYSDKGKDNYYWSRHALDMFAEPLKVSKEISSSHAILSIIKPDIDLYINKLWTEMDFVVKSRLFKSIPVESSAFTIVENILLEKVGSELIFESMRKEMKYDTMEYPDKVVYFIAKNWDKLTSDEQSAVSSIFLKDITKYDNKLKLFLPLANVITPLDKIIKLFESAFFSDEIKDTDVYQACVDVLESRTLRSRLNESLKLKPEGEAKVKI